MRNNFLSFILILIGLSARSQELNCRVIINDEQVQTQERSIFPEMELAFSEFMNNQKWTDHDFTVEERINCNIIITLDPEQSDPSLGNFGASVQILSSRPVFNSDYESIVFNFADRDWLFEYVASQPLQFNENSFTNNLSALLGFYAYVIIGFDFDTFSEMGGDSYFRKAANIVNTAQQSGYPGWEQFNSIRNRYWLSENLLNNQMQPIREALYEYHIKGLDIIQEQPDEARTNISNSLKKVLNVNQARPRAILTISFMDAKSNELAQIFSQGDPSLRRNVFNLLVNIDPTKREMFQPLIK